MKMARAEKTVLQAEPLARVCRRGDAINFLIRPNAKRRMAQTRACIIHGCRVSRSPFIQSARQKPSLRRSYSGSRLWVPVFLYTRHGDQLVAENANSRESLDRTRLREFSPTTTQSPVAT